MKSVSHGKIILSITLLVLLAAGSAARAQFTIKWMAVGALHNWYSEIGCEKEEGRTATQQDGLQWPAIYEYQDMQAAKGLWIGVKDFTDEKGVTYPHKVVHIGPRATGAGEFFPLQFDLISRFEPPVVQVDGVKTFRRTVENDALDSAMKADRMLVNVVNSQTGISMTRKIMQFSQQYHDNYIVYEYTFTNTGNTDADAEIELPNKTLEGVYFYFQYRYAVCRQTRYVIGNGTGWGLNTMNDTRGDGVKPDAPNENFRAQFAWHGKFPPFTAYDNIGGPIWAPVPPGQGVGTSPSDTTGRLGATQFVGVVTLHADRSPTDRTDDPGQPATTSYEGSDDPENFGTSPDDATNPAKMTRQYAFMARGHRAPRHADVVEPSGNFAEPAGDPSLGTPGGLSSCNGYGPYTLRPGESIRIVMAEGAAGINRNLQESVGRQFKAGRITARAKNEIVLTGRDSLFQTFRRAIANFKSGYNIPQPPRPPKSFSVQGGADRISLSWEVYENDPNVTGFQIYRAKGNYDSTYSLIREVGASERSYNDTGNLERGPKYYYYIVAVGSAAQNNGAGLTPGGKLISGRYYTQTYIGTELQRAPGTSLSQIRVVPNPFILSADATNLRFPGERDKIAFFNIPGQCTIKIFSESGELIQTIEHTSGTGDEYWYSVASSGQVVVSGLYIAVVTDRQTGKNEIVKFVIVR